MIICVVYVCVYIYTIYICIYSIYISIYREICVHMQPHGAIWSIWCHVWTSGDKWGNILALFSFSRDLVATGGAFGDFVLMAQSHRRICEACLLTSGEWGTGTVGGGRCKQGRGRYWNNARCKLMAPEANIILLFPVLSPVHG